MASVEPDVRKTVPGGSICICCAARASDTASQSYETGGTITSESITVLQLISKAGKAAAFGAVGDELKYCLNGASEPNLPGSLRKTL